MSRRRTEIRLPPHTCYCGHSTNDPHYAYVAFLKLDNPRYYQVFMNKVTVWFTGSEYIHVQLAFWNDARHLYETFSVDQHQNKVFRAREKEFSTGWDFIKFSITQEEELVMYDFLTTQLGKPYNKWGHRLIALWRLSGHPRTWFCTELTLAAFQEIGWFLAYNPADMFPVDIYDLVCAQTRNASEVGHVIAIQKMRDENSDKIRRQQKIHERFAQQKSLDASDSDGDGGNDGDNDESQFDEDRGYGIPVQPNAKKKKQQRKQHRRAHVSITIDDEDYDAVEKH